MFTKRIRTALAAAGDKVTLDLGALNRFPVAGNIDVYCAADGANEAVIRGQSGTDTFLSESAIGIERVAGAGPLIPENQVGSGSGDENDPITLEVENVSSPTAAVVVTTFVSIR